MPSSLRDALRALRASRGTTAVALIVLTLAIAASTVTFSVVDNVVLRRLPFPDDDRLVVLSMIASRTGKPQVVAPQDFFRWSERQTTSEELAASGPWAFRVTTPDSVENIPALRVTPNLFHVLRVTPSLGQFFGSQHQETGQDGVAIITHAAWMSRFGGDPAIVGRVVTFSKDARTILGVLPPGFEYPVGLERPTQVFIPWVPRASERDEKSPGRGFYLTVIGRLKPGAEIAHARSEIEQIEQSRALSKTGRDPGPLTRMSSLHEHVVGDVG